LRHGASITMKYDRIPVWATKRPRNSCRNGKTDQPMEPASLHEVGLEKPDRSSVLLCPRRFTSRAICCIPSHQRGFDISIIEAAEADVPTVASRIYGITDAVIEALTRMLHPSGDVDAIE
jgi:hypothetical protein